MRLFIVACALASAAGLVSCKVRELTDAEAASVRATTSVAGTVFGLPPVVGDTLGAAIVAAIAAFAGHKNGRRTERKARSNA